MSIKLEHLFREILDKNESLSLDSETDKKKLITELVNAFAIDDWDNLQIITSALFPEGDIDEEPLFSELWIYTGIFNDGSAGERPNLQRMKK